MSATGRSGERVEADYYPTPAWCVHRLLEAVRLPGGAWLEPCVGDGAICKAVARDRTDVLWTTYDIRPDSCAATVGDFLGVHSPDDRPWASVCLTNPPYSLAMEFVQHAMKHAHVVAMLLRLNFLGSEGRAEFFRAHPPSVYVLPNRPSFVNGRTDACEYAWFVWGLHPTPEIRVLATTPKSERCGR